MENALAGGLSCVVDYEPAGRRDGKPTLVIISGLGAQQHAWRLTPDEMDTLLETWGEQAREARSGIVRAAPSPLLNGGSHR